MDRCLSEQTFRYLHYSDRFRCVKDRDHSGEHVYGVLGAAMRKKIEEGEHREVVLRG